MTKIHKTQSVILDYLQTKNLQQSDYEKFCDERGLRYLSLVSFKYFRQQVEK